MCKQCIVAAKRHVNPKCGRLYKPSVWTNPSPGDSNTGSPTRTSVARATSRASAGSADTRPKRRLKSCLNFRVRRDLFCRFLRPRPFRDCVPPLDSRLDISTREAAVLDFVTVWSWAKYRSCTSRIAWTFSYISGLAARKGIERT